MSKVEKTITAREHWKTAPPQVVSRISRALETGCDAFVQACFREGYDCNLDELKTPAIDALASGTPRCEVIRRYGSHREPAEHRAIALWHTKAEWRKTTRASEQQARIEAHYEAKRQDALKQRAAEIVAENEAENKRTQERAALAQAEKEFNV
jgi:hypothetical protein